MCRWCGAPVLSLILCSFCRLQGKVSTLMFPTTHLTILRARMLCIKHNGKFPSSRTLAEKENIHQLGTEMDHKTRAKKHRTNTKARQGLITRAQNFIFKQGLGVASAAVKRILDSRLLVPTVVSRQSHFIPHTFKYVHEECLLNAPSAIWHQLL